MTNADIQKIRTLAKTFMEASGFYGGGKEGTVGKKVLQGMNTAEKSEYSWELVRHDIQWAEFFSKAAIRQGLVVEAAACVPKNLVDDQTVSTLAQIENPNFAVVASLAKNSR